MSDIDVVDRPVANATAEFQTARFLSCRVLANHGVEDLEIITLPGRYSGAAVSEVLRFLDELSELRPEFSPPLRSATHNTISDTRQYSERTGHVVEGTSAHDKLTSLVAQKLIMPSSHPDDLKRKFATHAIYDVDIPLVNSPIHGLTIDQLVKLKPEFEYILSGLHYNPALKLTLLFATIAGYKIVIGAADGIAEGLRRGLSYVLLRWMGVPQDGAIALTDKPKLLPPSDKPESENEVDA